MIWAETSRELRFGAVNGGGGLFDVGFWSLTGVMVLGVFRRWVNEWLEGVVQESVDTMIASGRDPDEEALLVDAEFRAAFDEGVAGIERGEAVSGAELEAACHREIVLAVAEMDPWIEVMTDVDASDLRCYFCDVKEDIGRPVPTAHLDDCVWLYADAYSRLSVLGGSDDGC